ncbi:hypothetical protein [Aliiglaciecola sp. M165]|uniref:hypothetical protein n=1 Tax=Aliiglaciecola sp. M165 TaxID=2593649 RepID=UPI00118050F2|nr:hypothetical protein [Aliiglaciecola sp. M165]TRY29790.1 hypothetical protein FM019_16600 [Aliiglaciecola sp. M165]
MKNYFNSFILCATVAVSVATMPTYAEKNVRPDPQPKTPEGSRVTFQYGFDVDKAMLETAARFLIKEGCETDIKYSEEVFPGEIKVSTRGQSEEYEDPAAAATWALQNCLPVGK